MIPKAPNKKIIVIIQRSNGDVFFSATLIKYLNDFYNNPCIDLLVNSDTEQIAKLIPGINQILTFSYEEKKANRWSQEKRIFLDIYMKYDLSINLTASDRSVIYSIIASKKSISAIEKDSSKSWWKKILLSKFYYFDTELHIIENNLKPLDLLGIAYEKKVLALPISNKILERTSLKLKSLGIKNFFIFHPSAQYAYKVYPENLRNKLINLFKEANISIVVTGGNSKIDQNIKKSLPKFKNIFDFIGITSIEEYAALSELSSGYIGMDTLNMHISASQNKKVFAIFGPTNLKMWSPWSNISMSCANINNNLVTEYSNTLIFQADLPCVACGKAGCNDQHDESLCLNHINPELVYQKVQNFINDQKI